MDGLSRRALIRPRGIRVEFFCPVVVLPDQATTTTDGGSPTIQQKLDRLAWKTVYPQTQPLHGRYDKVWLRCIICYS
jgi:hypothetical protein